MANPIPGDAAMFLTALQEAEAGNPCAQFATGNCYMLGRGVEQDFKRAVHWYTLAAEQGNTRAQKALGNMHANSIGVPQDYALAIYWYRKAAERGNAKARFNLGLMYQIGHSVEKDYAEAFHWQLLAAEQGYAPAQFSIGLPPECYEMLWHIKRAFMPDEMAALDANTVHIERLIASRQGVDEFARISVKQARGAKG